MLPADHTGLVHLAAKRAASRGAEYDEALQDGMMGLLKAQERFDASRGLAFSTFAMPRIKGAISDGRRKRDWLSRRWRKHKTARDQASALLRSRLYREPTSREVAKEMGVPVEDIWGWRWDEPATLDAPAQEDGYSLQDVIAGHDGRDDSDQVERMLVVKARMKKLTPQELQVITLTYYDNKKLVDIAVIFGMTESRICQIHASALEKLRTRVRSIALPLQEPTQVDALPADLDELRREFVAHIAGMIQDKRVLPFIDQVVDHALRRGQKVQGLADYLQLTRRSLHWRLDTYALAGPNHWLMTAKLLHVIWSFARFHGSWRQCVARLDLGDEYSLSNLCVRVTGLRPPAIRRECRKARSIVPFVDRCGSYLRKAA